MDAWHWPQWTLAAIFAMHVFGAGILHGKPKEGTFNGVASCLFLAFEGILLHMGGFW